MTYAQQLQHQRAYARSLIEWGEAKRVTLVSVQYPGDSPRVSIIGHTISWGSVEAWRMNGATVTELEVIA